ncbi:MAG: PaeR7I family type II restriction endonuclease [Candidatus Bipolaricaulota bacterium]|nr:PaeR7I family type II restriction endonuclease [Candidatus Bipolaricaulota bacterium]
MKKNSTLGQIDRRARQAVARYWGTRSTQQRKQEETGRADQGLRSAVTGGAQMDGFVDLFTDLIVDAGISKKYIFRKKALQLPGFFRPTKEWDLLVVKDNTLIAAIEAKSQVGPSFGNNFNNRTEEAMGSALDLWTAYREGALLASPQPFLGYLFMLEDCAASNKPVKVREPHFKVFPEFVGASYMKRYELFCRKLVLERHYTSTAFITSDRVRGESGEYKTPAEDLSLQKFARTLVAHVSSFGESL